MLPSKNIPRSSTIRRFSKFGGLWRYVDSNSLSFLVNALECFSRYKSRGASAEWVERDDFVDTRQNRRVVENTIGGKLLPR